MRNVIDVDYHNIEKKYYTLDEIAKILNIDESLIVFYHARLNEFLKIQSIGMYQIFDDKDIENIRKIKELNVDKKMSVSEIKSYLKDTSKQLIVKKENTIDVSMLDFFAKIIKEQDSKMELLLTLLNENQKMMVNQNLQIGNLGNDIAQIVEDKVDMVVSQRIDVFKEEFVTKMQESNDIRQREFDINRDLRARLESRKQENDKKQGFLSRIINRK